MRNNTNFEIELPWKLKAYYTALATAISAVACSLGWLIFQLILSECLQRVSENLDILIKTSLSFEDFWPLPLLAFGAFTIGLYDIFERMLIRRLTML